MPNLDKKKAKAFMKGFMGKDKKDEEEEKKKKPIRSIADLRKRRDSYN